MPRLGYHASLPALRSGTDRDGMHGPIRIRSRVERGTGGALWLSARVVQGEISRRADPAQASAWPPIATGEHILLVSPTGTGKTLAAFLAILDRLIRAEEAGALEPRLRCVYVSPLRSLNYDIERNLSVPLDEIWRRKNGSASPIRVGVRTGDTTAHERRKLRDHPPHLLITTPESLSLLLSQTAWQSHWRGVEHIVVDEVHALAHSKRGADLAVSLERLAAHAARDPIRVGLSATCCPADESAPFLVGPSRTCRVIVAPPPFGTPPLRIAVESLIEPGESTHRGLSYRRLIRRLREAVSRNRTTIVFANTRALAEKLTHDLRQERAAAAEPEWTVSAHHSALDAGRRRAIEEALRSGQTRVVVTSTSLELGVDIGSADLAVQIGLPGGVARCVQRIGRAGHRRGAGSRGLLLAATPAELTGAVITAKAAQSGRVEPIRMPRAPLDVVCQQLIGMACAGEQSVDAVFELLRKTGPMAELARADFDDCLAFLAGELAGPAGATEPESGAAPRWTSPRLWKRDGRFGLQSRRVARWFWNNVGTIYSEETVRVVEGGMAVGTIEAAYAERLAPGDRFVLDGRVLEFRRLQKSIVYTRPHGGEPNLPRWTSDRQSLSKELAGELAGFRTEAARRLVEENAEALRSWLAEVFDLSGPAAEVLIELMEAQAQWSEIPSASGLLVEESPSPRGEGLVYVFHAPCTARPVRRSGEQPRRDWAGDSAATSRSRLPIWAGQSTCRTMRRRQFRPRRSSFFSIWRGLPTMCSRGWTGAVCRRGGSGTSPQLPSWCCGTRSPAAACASAASTGPAHGSIPWSRKRAPIIPCCVRLAARSSMTSSMSPRQFAG